MSDEHASNTVFYDEEECLGFGVFVAELELIVGTSRDRRPDQVQLLELLQKLQSSISITDSNVVKQHQKRCEAALYDIVYKGACSVVRNYVAVCLSKLYTAGDSLPLYSKVNILQTFLQDKTSTAAEVVRLGVIDVLSHLTSSLGKYLASSTVESMTIAAKAADKSSSNRMKAAGLRLAACVVEALPYQDRNTTAVQAEAWKLVERQVKDKSSDELRAAGAAVLSAMCRAGGSYLWSAAGYYADEALRLSVAALDDAASQSTTEAFAVALADLAASARRSNPALAAALDAEKKPAKRQQLEKLANGMFKAALVQPFVDAAVQSHKDVLTAMALSWSTYAASVDLANGADGLVELVVKAVEMLELAHKTAAEGLVKGQPAADGHNIGTCLAGGELPAASAAVIYFIRVSVIRRLTEPGQRKLLAALARATSHAIAPPVIVAALEGCGVLLEILGEVHDEAAIKAVENAAMSKLSASSTVVRHQAAAVLAALALSSPPLLARLFGECLEGVETFCQQLMLLAAPYNKPRSSSVINTAAAGPGTPRGAPDSQTKHCIDGLHGNALAVGSLLVASARSALGAPSRLTRSVFWIAKRMISQPYCSSPWAVAAEREAGYILLGCMCAAAAPGLLTGREKQQQILELFSIALGPSAAEALTGAAAAAAGADVAGTDAAVACWWRAAALRGLSAYVLGVMGKGHADNPAQQVRLIASLLSPLLEVICNTPHLADPAAAAAAPTAAAAPAQATSAAAARAPSPAGTAVSGHQSPRPTTSNSGAAAPAPGSATAAAATANGSAAAAAVGAAFSSPVAAAAAAVLQMQLLEVFFFLPGAQFWSHCHGQLMQLCCRQLMGVGGSRVLPDYAGAVANSSLRHMLNSQDALLGPWLPGRDMLEDELRTFVGEPGGPQQHPWEVGAAFTEGFITYSQALLPPDDSETAAAAAATATAAAAVAVGAGGAITAAAAAFADDALALGGGSCDGSRKQRRGVDGVRLRRRSMPYPQPCALGPALLESQMWLLGKLLAVVATAKQVQILEIMLNAVSLKSFSTALSNSTTRPAALKQRAANCTAVAVAGLAGLGSVAKRARGEAGADKLAERILQLASCMLEDQVSDPCLARAGAEMMAAATAMGSTTLASSQVKAVTIQLSAMMVEANVTAAAGGTASSSGATADGTGSGGSAELRAVLSLVVGCLHRSEGGAALQPTVKATVDALTAVASRPIGTAHIWALHGLWLVACAAGPGYAAHVEQSLQLAVELLVSSFGENPLLQPAAARLANAMIAVLGPEFTLGSAAYSKCKTLVTCYNATSSGANRGVIASGSGTAGAAGGGEGIRGLAATWAELEQVLFAQQLILFAPGAVPAAKHLPLLLATLTSSRPALRRAAAATLQHLAERNPFGLAEACIEATLLAALDAESEPTTSAQLRHAVNTMLVTTAAQKPGYFVMLLGAVALAAAPAAAIAAAVAPAGQAAAAGTQADTAEDDDDAERPVAAAAAPAVPATANSSGPASVAAAAAARLPQTPRLRTRLFAAELLLSLFAAVGGDPRHKFPQPKYEEGKVAAGATAAGGGDQGQQDYLVQHLQPLIDLGYKLTTSPLESLRPSGAQLLQQILRYFGTVADPDVPDMLLLEQYQAQFVAALRAALASGAAPALAVCGGNLAISFLGAGLAAGDGAVMRRLMDLLIAPLDSWQALLYGGYAESVGVRARVALLQAHAQCANLASAFASSSGGSAATSGARSLQGVGGSSGRGGFGASISPTSSNNDLCRSIVVKSQASYKDMLLLLWWGVLLDYAAFSSPLPGFVDNHKSLLFGDTYPEVVEAVQGTYASAWPPVLVALASNLPPAADLAAAAADLAAAAAVQQQRQAAWSTFVDQISSGAGFNSGVAAAGSSTSRRGTVGDTNASITAANSVFSQQLKIQCAAMHSMLIDISLMLLCYTASACAAALSKPGDQDSANGGSSSSSRDLPVAQQQVSTAAVAAAQRAAVALQALQLLLSKQHFEAGPVTTAICQEAAGRLGAFAVDLLAPWQQQQCVSQQQQQQQQFDGDHVAVGSTTDKVFGLVLVAAADLLQSLIVGLPYAKPTTKQQQHHHQHQQQESISAAAAAAAALEALLALMSIAVPYEQYQTPPSSEPTTSSSSSSSAHASRDVAYAPAHTSSSSSSDGSRTTSPPSPQAAAACSSLCHAGSNLIQQLQQQPDLSGPSPGSLISRIMSLGLRLLLTAAPGGQLTAAQQLTDCCWTAAAAQQQLSRVTDLAAARAAAVAAAEALGTAAAVTRMLCDAVCTYVDQACRLSSSSSSGSWSGIADPAARLPVVLSALLSAAACCCCSDTAAEGAAATAAAAAVQQCCGTLQYCLQQFGSNPQQQQQQLGGDTPAAVVACRVLETVRLLLQESAAAAAAVATEQQGLQRGKVKLSQMVTAAVVPQVAVLIHESMNNGRGPLSGAELMAVTEGLKVLLLLANKTAAQGEAAQVAVMNILVPLLIEVAKPQPQTPVTPILRDMACKLVSAMPTSAAAAAFRTAVVALPASSKQRLQMALKEQAAAAAAAAEVQAGAGRVVGGVGRAPAGAVGGDTPVEVRRAPAIQLKMNFALPSGGNKQ